MARRPNYGFEKRKKEMDRKQKQEAKLLRRQEEAKERAEQARETSDVPDGAPEQAAPNPATSD
jgi:hypothetical protein